VTNAGTVWCWGNNSYGQLGTGNTEPRSTPVQVPGVNNVVRVTGAGTHSCALQANGQLLCWGVNSSGAFADPLYRDTVAFATSIYESCAVQRDGRTLCWKGLGDNHSSDKSLDGVGWATVGLSGDDIWGCSATTQGAVACWGYNGSGQLGNGTTDSRATTPPNGIYPAVLVTDLKLW
jgi:alpha-tubulin suppressor-like RCC1 family protein